MDEKLELPPIRCTTYIHGVPPERVYETLTTTEGWDAWFTQGMSIDPRPGGEIKFKWVNFKVERYTCESPGKVLEADGPKRFAFQWKAGDSFTTIEIDLESRGPGTVARLKESGHGWSQKDLNALVECSGGWGEALALLKMYLEHGKTFGEVPEA